MNIRHWLVVGIMAMVPSTIGAQGVTLQPGGPGTIVGIVLDINGNPLDSADIYIVELRRRTLADGGGRFRFDSIEPGNYTLGARRIGFMPGSGRVFLSPEGATIAIRLSAIRGRLPTVVTSAERGGLSGVVSDSAFNVLPGAQLLIIGSSRRAVSDSAGAFYIKVPTGKFMLSVKKEGFRTKLVSVTVPPDSGRRVLVAMSAGTDGWYARENVALDAMRERLVRRSAVYSNLHTREDINRSGVKDVAQLARSGATRLIQDDCLAIIDGGPATAPLWSLLAADVEMMEVYHTRPPRNTSASIRARAPRMGTASTRSCETVYVWLRK